MINKLEKIMTLTPKYEFINMTRLSWLVGCFWFKGPLRQYFQSISGRLPKRGRKRRDRIEEQEKCPNNPPTRTYCKRSRPLPYCNPNCRTLALEVYPAPSHHPTTPRPDRDRGCIKESDLHIHMNLLYQVTE